MVWQDITIFICTLLFGYALLPQIVSNSRNKKCSIHIQTSLITFLGMFVMSIAFFTLQLYMSAAIDIALGTLWMIIFIQGMRYR